MWLNITEGNKLISCKNAIHQASMFTTQPMRIELARRASTPAGQQYTLYTDILLWNSLFSMHQEQGGVRGVAAVPEGPAPLAPLEGTAPLAATAPFIAASAAGCVASSVGSGAGSTACAAVFMAPTSCAGTAPVATCTTAQLRLWFTHAALACAAL